MSSSFKVMVPPAIEPILLQDVKSYLRVDFSDDDAMITGLITRARSLAETVTHRAMATQTIQELFTIERPLGGSLSGTIERSPNWYQYQEQLGANPFGAAQFYFDLSMPPVQAVSLVETKVIAFDDWLPFTGVTWLDDTTEPARMYFQSPITANFWRFTYTCGYSFTYPVPYDIQQGILEAVAYWYQYREAQDLPQALINKLLAQKVDWV